MFHRDIKNSVSSCVAAIGKNCEMSFVFQSFIVHVIENKVHVKILYLSIDGADLRQ